MISFEEAYRIVMENAVPAGSERISFIGAEGRVLAEDVVSDIDMPPFNRAAVDGYACRIKDINSELELLEVIAAGKEPQKEVGKNQCSKIMTGAIVPTGCDIVFMVEDSEELPGGKIRFTGQSMKPNLSLKGEDVKKGQTVLVKGRLIRPQDVAVLASVGLTDVLVKQMPEVGIISTGDELVEPQVKPSLPQIRNSNAYQLLSQVIRAGGKARYYGIAPDTGDSAFHMISRAIDENNIVILTGGVSMGDYDFVPSFLKRAGVKLLFDRVNVQPGKPTTFGVHHKAVVFGLPGNPVSSFIQFEALVRPLMAKMTESDWVPLTLDLSMGVDYERKSASRMGWIPANVSTSSEVVPVDYHGSAHLTSLSYCDGIFAMKPGLKSLKKGETVKLRYL